MYNVINDNLMDLARRYINIFISKIEITPQKSVYVMRTDAPWIWA